MKSPKAYLDPEVAQAARAAGLEVPDPNDAGFEQKIIELAQAGSPWAAKLQGGVIYSGLGDPRESFRKETRKEARKRAVHNRLLKRQDPDTGEHVNDKNKLWFLGAASALAVVLLFLGMTFVGTLDRAEAQSGVAEAADPVAEAAEPVAEAGAADRAATGNAPFESETTPDAGVMGQVRAFGAQLDQTLTGEGESVGATLTGDLVDSAPSDAAETYTSSGTAESGADTATETLPATSALVVVRPRAASSPVLTRVVPATPLTLDARPGNRSAVVVARQGQPAVSAVRAPSLSSSVLSSRVQPRTGAVVARAPSVPDQTTNQVEATAQAAASAAPQTADMAAAAPEPELLGSYEGPDLYAQAEAATGEFVSGDVLDGVLEVGILTTEGAVVPTLVRTEGGVWQGSASFNSVGRVEISLSQVTAGGRQLSVNALVVGADGYPGLDATVREATPALAADLVAAGLRGVSDYVGELADAGTVIDDGSRVVVNSQAVPLEWALAGSLAELFSPPTSQRAVVRVAEVPAGTRVSVRVF